MKLSDWLRALPFYVLPHHFLSRIVLKATRWRFGPWKDFLIRSIVRAYSVNVSEAAETDLSRFGSFNEFFTRALKTNARPVSEVADLVPSPVDGAVSEAGRIDANRVFQAKGRTYTLGELLGCDDYTETFSNGQFATLYLSPRDYHRIHMPLDGTLKETLYIPGRLFSVAPFTVRTVPRVFARNERLVCIFETAIGDVAVILVGALFVACIETAWDGVVTPPHGHSIVRKTYENNEVRLKRGQELGRFNMGSTVILLFEPGRINWDADLISDAPVRMGKPIAQLSSDHGTKLPITPR